MMEGVSGIQRILLMAVGCAMFGGLGCSATQVALEKKDLKVQTKMSQSIFLDLDNQIEKSAFLEIKNTSDKDIDFDTPVRQAIEARGYKIVDNAKEAAYIYQVNILYVGEADPAALRTAVHAGYGSAWG
ncbi:MAG: complement resistance protein TraT, partial [Nitrospirota bacterium]|nr:complement resistance protein TraT [Nitrospirota bacterium]